MCSQRIGSTPKKIIRPDAANRAELHLNSALTVLPSIADKSIDLIVTDPPYFIDGMGDDWNVDGLRRRADRAKVVGSLPTGMKFDPRQAFALQSFMRAVFEEALRVLKPGGFCITFSQARLYHRMGVAAEDAGFEVRDMLGWVYEGQAKAFSQNHFIRKMNVSVREKAALITSLAGRKTPQLKPCIEPMVLAQKPKEGTFVANWTKHGVGLVDTTQTLDGKFPGNLMRVPKPTREEKGIGNDHLTVKPVALIAHLIKLFSTEGQIVLDPFMGSGSHGIAAAQSGRRFIGVEINPKHFRIAEDRIASAASSTTPRRLSGGTRKPLAFGRFEDVKFHHRPFDRDQFGIAPCLKWRAAA